MDTRDDEKERGITIKSTAITMYMHMEKEDTEMLKQKTDGAQRLFASLAGPPSGLRSMNATSGTRLPAFRARIASLPRLGRSFSATARRPYDYIQISEPKPGLKYVQHA